MAYIYVSDIELDSAHSRCTGYSEFEKLLQETFPDKYFTDLESVLIALCLEIKSLRGGVK